MRRLLAPTSPSLMLTDRWSDLAFVENLLIDAHPSKDDASPWYYGISLRDRKSGWFPSSYVVEIPEG